MKNWSENIKWHPGELLYPENENEIIDIIKRAKREKKNIRPIGSGHSFTPLCATEGISLSLDKMQAVQTADEEHMAIAEAGIKLKKLGDSLLELGLAQENLGDINVQSLAGAISTGTHGTGTQFGSVSSQLTEISFINGKGELHHVSAASDPDLFRCLQVNLGVLGIITRAKIRCIPAYNLHLIKKKERVESVLQNLEKYNAENRNFEFYWFPHTPYAQCKFSNNIAETGKERSAFYTWFHDIFLENHMLELISAGSRQFPSLTPFLSRLTAGFIGEEEKIKSAHNVFATVRNVKFTETEYSVPMEHYKTVMQEIIRAFEKAKYPINFPVENRFVSADEPYLSTSYARPSAYIACHAYKGVDNTRYFADMEEIFRHYEGRPHWGKMHNCSSDYLQKQYAQWDKFMAIREEHDPEGIFLSPYMKKLLGL